MAEFVGQAVAEYCIRPRRIAHLVQSGNRGQLLRALRYASSEWGGITQLMIPVARKRGVAPVWLQCCDTFEPEIFIDYAPAPQLHEALKSKYQAAIFDEASLSHWEPGVHALVAIPSGDLAGRQMQVPKDHTSLVQTAVLGCILEAHESHWRETGISSVPISSDLELFSAQLRGSSQIESTRAQLTTFEISNGRPA